MKLFIIIYSLFFSSYIYNGIDQDFQVQLDLLQQTANTLITQSNIDPEIAQDLTNKINNLKEYAQNNIKEDSYDIRIATACSCIIETATEMLKYSTLIEEFPIITSLKPSARTNTIHKLLIGLHPGRFAAEHYYTNPYAESIGFISNDCLLNYLIYI